MSRHSLCKKSASEPDGKTGPWSQGLCLNGAEGIRTPDLNAASVALSQLSYGPAAVQSSRQALAALTSTDGTSPHNSSRR